jgi:hypothetical protein
MSEEIENPKLKIKVAFSVDQKIKNNLEEFRKIGFTNSSDLINRLLKFDMEALEIFIKLFKFKTQTKIFAKTSEGTLVVRNEEKKFFNQILDLIIEKAENADDEKSDSMFSRIYNFASEDVFRNDKTLPLGKNKEEIRIANLEKSVEMLEVLAHLLLKRSGENKESIKNIQEEIKKMKEE